MAFEDEEACAKASGTRLHHAGCQCHEGRWEQRVKDAEMLMWMFVDAFPVHLLCKVPVECGSICGLPKMHKGEHRCGLNDVEDCPA